MRSYVVDASAIGIGSPLLDDADALFAPELIDLEIASLLRKAVLRHERSADEAAVMLAAWAANDVVRFPHAPHLGTIWSLRDNITPYDAAYVALTMHLGSTLLTGDRRLAASASRFCEVVVVD